MPPSTGVSVVSAIGLEGPDGEIPAEAEEPIAASLRGGTPASFDGGWIAFPLASGALAVQLPSIRPISDADREWLLTLVSQGEQALDRAGRYETERGIAETMQRSVLPERLPTVSGVTLAARYLPARSESTSAETGTTSSSSRTAPSASSSATWSARAFRPLR